MNDPRPPVAENPSNEPSNEHKKAATESKEKEFGGPKGPEPTRYGDWEVNGRVSDF